MFCFLLNAASLPERRIRDLNDEINRLIREKFHWERRIVELGGANLVSGLPTYSFAYPLRHEHLALLTPKVEKFLVLVATGTKLLSAFVIFARYFGEARNLPGVKELLELPEEPDEAPEKQKGKLDINKCIDADYYGFRDDEDGLLEKLESSVEQRCISFCYTQTQYCSDC